MKQKKSVLLAVSVMATLLAACGNGSEEQKKNAAPMRVECEVVNLSSEMNRKSYVGVVEEESSISVGFNGSGTITKVYVCEGQKVKKGQPIAEIDKTQALNMLSTAEAQMQQANDSYHRLKQLHENKSLPEIDWVDIQTKVRQAEATLEMAKKSLADCRIYASESGIIGKNVMHVGEVVLPAQPVAKILVIDNIKVRCSIPESEIAGISSSQTSQISIKAIPGQSFSGGKIEKCIEANSITRTYDIKINVCNAEQVLLPGMVANVEISDMIENKQMTVPITSVRKNARGEHFVWSIKDNMAVMSIISTGKAVGDRIIVQKGLHQGDVIVTEGYHKLSEGMEVER